MVKSMNIGYDSYRIFYYVAKYGNVTQAANVLMLSQPNVTRSIKNLESQLGCLLFVRSNRGMSLTPEGERLFSHVSVAVEQLQAGESEISFERSMEGGIVTVGVTESGLHGALLPTLKNFRKRYPGIRIKINNYSTLEATAALRSGAVDFSVVTTPTGVSKPIYEKKLRSFREIPVAGPSYAYLADKKLHLSELLDYPIISLARGSKTYDFYSSFFLEHGLTLSPDMEAATIDQVLPMVKYDLGIGFMPERFIEEPLKNGEIVKLDLYEPVPYRNIALLGRVDRPLSIAASELEKLIVSENS